MALGTMYFGTTLTQPQAWECLDTAAALGATFWDTSNNYAFWAGGTGDESESVLGEWFASRGAHARDQIVLASKVGARPLAGHSDLDHVAGLSAPAIREQVTASLLRLRTDRLDVLYAHVDDQSVAFEETLGAFADLVEEGLVREVAASNLTAKRLAEALTVTTSHPYRALQQRFTYLQPAATADTAPQVVLDDATELIAETAGITLVGYSPLLSGAYTRKDRPLPSEYDTPANTVRLERLREVTKSSEMDAGQVVLAWMKQRPRAVIPIVGVSSPSQVRSAWSAVTTDIPAALMSILGQ
ncbi:aldo/keto reductase [Tessaracoccus antarcticus]|nr:aldo/keto reductase [Tessaracoccus antarcticus]